MWYPGVDNSCGVKRMAGASPDDRATVIEAIGFCPLLHGRRRFESLNVSLLRESRLVGQGVLELPCDQRSHHDTNDGLNLQAVLRNLPSLLKLFIRRAVRDWAIKKPEGQHDLSRWSVLGDELVSGCVAGMSAGFQYGWILISTTDSCSCCDMTILQPGDAAGDTVDIHSPGNGRRGQGLRDPLILPYRSIRESCWTEMSRTWKCECFELELWLYASA